MDYTAGKAGVLDPSLNELADLINERFKLGLFAGRLPAAENQRRNGNVLEILADIFTAI